MNDVLDPAPLFICESLIARLEAFDVAAIVTVVRLVMGLLHGWVTIDLPNRGLGWKDVCRDEAVSQGVPRRCREGRQEP